MTTPYSPVQWVDNEPTWTEKLNQMTNNDQWLFENTPRAMYNSYKVKRTSQIKILTGVTIFPAQANGLYQIQVDFPSFFTPGCLPTITTGVGYRLDYRIHLAFRGIGQDAPDHRGMIYTASVDPRNPDAKYYKFGKAFYAHYIAVGY